MASYGDDIKQQSWQSVVLADSQLWTDVTLTPYITDVEFNSLLRKVGDFIEVLDCTGCTQLTQDSFLTLSRQPVVVLPRLRTLLLPTELTLPDAVFEALASAGSFPQIERIDNIQTGSSVCNPLRCQTYFKKSRLSILNDSPMASHGRIRRLLIPDSVEAKQRRQRWDADLAKAAISCPTIDTYRCCRGLGYVDDKSLERISVLFPKLRALHLQLCSITDDGLAKFFAHNRRDSSSCSKTTDVGLTRLSLDRPGEISDKGLETIGDNCPCLSQLALCRCAAVTPIGLRHIVSRCKHISELYLSNVSCIDDVTLTSLGDTCRQLTSLQLFDVSPFTSRGLGNALRHCTQLVTLTLHNCHCLDDDCIDVIVKHCHSSLKSFSLGIGSSQLVSPRAVISCVMRCAALTSLAFTGNSQFQIQDLKLFAEQTYILLSNDVTCRSSRINSMVLTSVGGNFVQLLTVLCSELKCLDLRDVQVGDEWPEILSRIVTDCTQLDTLDVTGVESGITDQFLIDLCQFGLELRHIGLVLDTNVSRDVIEALIQTSPSLSSLSVCVRQSKQCSSSTASEQGLPLDENYFIKVIQQCRGSSTCYCDVVKQTGSKTKRYQFVFSPLKFASAGGLAAEL